MRRLIRPTSSRSDLPSRGVELVEGDPRDSVSLDRAFAAADVLVNLASLGGEWVDSLFDAIARSKLVRGVFVSTTAILTRLPVRSKPLREHGEACTRASGLAWTILRPTMIYGTPGDRNIARLIRFIHRSPVIPLVAGPALQQPVHVEDVPAAVVACVAEPATIGGTYEISGREPLTLAALIRQTIDALGRRRLLVPLPIWLVHTGLRVYATIASRPRISVEQLLRLQEDKAFDHGAARRDFAFAPRPFADGVRAEVALVEASTGRR